MRITTDTSILVRAFLSPNGIGREVLLKIADRGDTLVLSNEMLSELATVLRYPRVAARHGKPEGTVYDFVEGLREMSEIVRLSLFLSPPIRDANDIIVMQTAELGRAEVLCTTDEDFYQPPAARYLANLGILVLDEMGLMKRLR